MKLSEIKSLLERKEFFSIVGVEMELGYKTKHYGIFDKSATSETLTEEIKEYVDEQKKSVILLFEPAIEVKLGKGTTTLKEQIHVPFIYH